MRGVPVLVSVIFARDERRTWRCPHGHDQLAPRGARDVTAGTGCGRCRGDRARQPPVRQQLPPRNGETPGNPGRLRPVIPAALLPSVARACSRSLALAARPGAPKVRP